MMILQIYRSPRASVGDTLLAVIRQKAKQKKYVKNKIYFIFLVSRKSPVFRKRGGYYLRLLINRAVVLNPDKERLLGTRHQGFLTLESRARAASMGILKGCRVIL